MIAAIQVTLFKLYAMYMPALCILIRQSYVFASQMEPYIVYAKAVYFKDVGVKEME